MNWKNPLLLITSAFQLFHARFVERHQETYSSLKGNYVELWTSTIFIVMSVRPRGTTWIALDKLLWNIISEYIPTIWREKRRNFTMLWAGIAIRYGLEGPGIDPGGAKFSAPIHTGPGAHPVSFSMGTGPFPWVKRAGLWRWTPTHI